jgi:hypothetical protein
VLRSGSYLGPLPNDPWAIGPPATLFVASFPHRGNTSDEVSRDATILQCTLWNVTRTSTFTYTNTAQQIDNELDFTSGAPVSPVQAFVLNGSNPEAYRPTLERMSFQAILDTLTYFINGAISYQASSIDELGYWTGNKSNLVIGSGIVRTILLDTPELTFLKSNATSALTAFDNTAVKGLESLFPTVTTATAMPLRDALESIFQNMSLSMLSSPALRWARRHLIILGCS